MTWFSTEIYNCVQRNTINCSNALIHIFHSPCTSKRIGKTTMKENPLRFRVSKGFPSVGLPSTWRLFNSFYPFHRLWLVPFKLVTRVTPSRSRKFCYSLHIPFIQLGHPLARTLQNKQEQRNRFTITFLCTNLHNCSESIVRLVLWSSFYEKI